MITNSECLLTFAIINNSVALDHGVVSHLYFFIQSFIELKVTVHRVQFSDAAFFNNWL